MGLDFDSWGKGKKIIVILIICCVGAIIIGSLSNMASPDANTNKDTGVQIKVITNSSWSGAITDFGGATSSYDGDGDKIINVTNKSSDTVSATIQKKSGNSKNLVVQIIKNGKVTKEGNTTAEYGVVSVSG